MVELQCTNSAAGESSVGLEAEEYTTRCRLCGRVDNDGVASDIFLAPATLATRIATLANSETHDDDADSLAKQSLAALLHFLFNINYEQHELLPRHICVSCLDMVRLFYEYRQCLHKSEQDLQKQLQRIRVTHPKYRPGLNGNAGDFEPDEDCEIIEVNPEQDFISSDDEFSMASESDEEEEDIDAANDLTHDDDMEDDATELNTNTTTSTAPSVNTGNILQPIIATAMGAANMGPFLQTTQQAAVAAAGVPDAMGPFSGGLEVQPKNTFLCQFCDLAFTTQSDCHYHELRQHDPMLPYSCSFCQLRVASRQMLISHIRELHDSERPYVCVHCNKGFCRRSDLKKHTIVHTGVRPFTCAVCSKSFSRNTNLTKHMRIHSSVKPFVCQVCPRSFHTAMEMMRHTRSHTEVKPYQCSRCPTSFTRKDKLQVHEQVHVRRDAELLQQQARMAGNNNNSNNNTGRVPVALEQMIGVGSQQQQQQQQQLQPALQQTDSAYSEAMDDPSTYYHNSILAAQLQQQLPAKATAPPLPPPALPMAATTHQAKSTSHSRNYKCDICAKAFQRERDLQRHQALHLDTLFTCKLCGLGFSRREKLARHELEQHAPHFPCDICRITFTRREELEHHLKMHELQQHVAINTQAALNAVAASNQLKMQPDAAKPTMSAHETQLPVQQMAQPPMSAAASSTAAPQVQLQRPSAADMSFYSQLVPTMNLGFYSETHPDERNGI